ncbi:hypothetical protein I7I53_02919 [Histoplasma capsulatum var. duboisii H88]|uniref:Uncharacterized protein n=1 Tax=Ajellomyces capsulatus (strain H88) TaxID=544711 RepID=A0A8A1LLC2_AJEC8|nr:hypothetical protein I7I53_02919 [Histoplasma capsulatum var. duboisii H88]
MAVFIRKGMCDYTNGAVLRFSRALLGFMGNTIYDISSDKIYDISLGKICDISLDIIPDIPPSAE